MRTQGHNGQELKVEHEGGAQGNPENANPAPGPAVPEGELHPPSIPRSLALASPAPASRGT